MDFVAWEEKYSVGIDEIDLQHQELFRILNKMIGILGKASKEELRAILDNMIDYASFHFETEEQYFHDHPDFKEHQHEHDIFMEKNKKLNMKLKEADQDISLDVLNFLLVWLKNHILKTDIKFFNEIQ